MIIIKSFNDFHEGWLAAILGIEPPCVPYNYWSDEMMYGYNMAKETGNAITQEVIHASREKNSFNAAIVQIEDPNK